MKHLLRGPNSIQSNLREKGSLTIEAALGLFVFILVTFAWISILQLLRIQSMVYHALDQVTLEVASQITFADALGNQADELETVLGHAGFQKATQDKEDNWIGIDKTLSAITNIVNPTSAYLTHLLFNYLEGEETNFGVVMDRNQLTGINWTLDVDTNSQMLNLDLRYELALPVNLGDWTSLQIRQESATGLWKLPQTDIALTDNQDDESNEDDSNGASIWDASSFDRGRYFASIYRDSAKGQAVKTGKGFDVYYPPDRLEEVFSLQIFSKTYATGEGSDPKAYTLKIPGLERALINRINKMKDNYQKHDQIELTTGELIPLHSDMSLGLHIIVPEEATLFKNELDQIIRKLEKEQGINLEISYREKKFKEGSDEKD